MTDVATLAARLDTLEQERGVLQLLHTYGQTIDYGEEERWVDCFTEDGIFDIQSSLGHMPSRFVEGREALRTFISRHTRAPELWHKHMMVEPLISVDGDRGTCSCYFLVLMADPGDGDTPVVRVFGRYVDDLERGSDGKWRFKHRKAEVEAMRRGLPPFVDGRPGLT
jgi:hypothetical protein